MDWTNTKADFERTPSPTIFRSPSALTTLFLQVNIEQDHFTTPREKGETFLSDFLNGLTTSQNGGAFRVFGLPHSSFENLNPSSFLHPLACGTENS